MDKRTINQFNIETIHSAILTASTAVVTHPINWLPDFWVLVSELSSGYLQAYPSGDKSPIAFRAVRHTVVIPMTVDKFTVETFAATGWYSLYAVKNLDGFSVQDA